MEIPSGSGGKGSSGVILRQHYYWRFIAPILRCLHIKRRAKGTIVIWEYH